jgi:hypothetical protein
MKILHALLVVGYFAFTALPTPVCVRVPTAAIHYNGYVNATQYQIDGALMQWNMFLVVL